MIGCCLLIWAYLFILPACMYIFIILCCGLLAAAAGSKHTYIQCDAWHETTRIIHLFSVMMYRMYILGTWGTTILPDRFNR